MPTTTREPVLSRIARGAFESKILGALASSGSGLGFGQLRDMFPGQPITATLDRLVGRGEVRRFDGCFFSITSSGRMRLSPPVCVIS